MWLDGEQKSDFLFVHLNHIDNLSHPNNLDTWALFDHPDHLQGNMINLGHLNYFDPLMCWITALGYQFLLISSFKWHIL